MPPTRAGDDRPRLPHRLGDGEPEALGEALLHDDVGASLDRVDDRRVLLDVVHRQAGEVHALAQRRSAARARARAPRRAPRRPRGRRRPPPTYGPGEHQVRTVVVASARRSPSQHARRVLEPVPARDLDDQRRVRRERAAWSISARRSTRPGSRPCARTSARRSGAFRPRARRAPGSPRRSPASSSWFFGEKASIDGATIQTRSRRAPPRRTRAREDVGVARGPRRAAGSPRRVARSSLGGRAPTWQRQTTRRAVSHIGSTSPRSAGRGRKTMSPARRARELLGGAASVSLVDRALGVPERPPSPARAVEAVVDALGDREELRVALDHDPAGVDARAPRVGEQRLQQLRHPPPGRSS